MIRDRVMAALDRARNIERIRAALDECRSLRETARLLKISAAKVSEVRRMTAARIDLHHG